jgi:hypothetical protein
VVYQQFVKAFKARLSTLTPSDRIKVIDRTREGISNQRSRNSSIKQLIMNNSVTAASIRFDKHALDLDVAKETERIIEGCARASIIHYAVKGRIGY